MGAGEERGTPTRASRALRRWLAENEKSQADFAERVTSLLGRIGRARVNQTTISGWARGTFQPGGPAMVAIQELTGILVTDWIIPADDESSARSVSDKIDGDAA